MDNKEFKDIIHFLLKPYSFKRKGNFWRFETNEIEKIVNLQKSNFSNLYYINYGYNFKKLYNGDLLMHIFNRLSPSEAFDLENQLDSVVRFNMIKNIFENNLLIEICKINNEKDIDNLLKNRPTLNDIPLIVKEYLKINEIT